MGLVPVAYFDFFTKKQLFKENLRKLWMFHKSLGKVTAWGGTTTMIIMVRWTEGGKSHEFQHCKCRHSGIGEKETQTLSVVGKKYMLAKLRLLHLV